MKPITLRWLRVSPDSRKLSSPRTGVLCVSLITALLAGAVSDGVASERPKATRVRGEWHSAGGKGGFEGSANAMRFEWEIFREAAAAGGLAPLPEDSAGDGEVVFLGCTSAAVKGAGLDLCVPHRSLAFHILKRERSAVQSLPDLRRKQIVVVEGSEVIPFLMNLGFGEQLLRVQSVQGAAGLLSAGKREVAIIDRFALDAELPESDLEGLAVLPEPVHSASSGFAVRAGSDALRLALEKGLGTIRRDGRYERIAGEHLVHTGRSESRGILATVRENLGWFLIPLALLLLASCVVALALRQRAMEKILSLQEQVMEEKIRLARVRDDSAKQRFVLNQLSTVSLVDQLLESSGSRGDEKTVG